MKLWPTLSLGALVLGLSLLIPLSLPGCWGGGEPCEQDLDCLILCECGTLGGSVTVGPYQCRLGGCGAQHSADLDCVEPCAQAMGATFNFDDDDSSADDDDSGADDDDSSAGR